MRLSEDYKSFLDRFGRVQELAKLDDEVVTLAIVCLETKRDINDGKDINILWLPYLFLEDSPPMPDFLRTAIVQRLIDDAGRLQHREIDQKMQSIADQLAKVKDDPILKKIIEEMRQLREDAEKDETEEEKEEEGPRLSIGGRISRENSEATICIYSDDKAIALMSLASARQFAEDITTMVMRTELDAMFVTFCLDVLRVDKSHVDVMLSSFSEYRDKLDKEKREIRERPGDDETKAES
jgi:hypothetical protein